MHDVRALNELVAKESAFTDTLINEVGKVIVGQTYMLERILIGLLTGGHVLLEGVPGLAKTLTVRTLCDSIQRQVRARPVHARPAPRRSRRHGRSTTTRRASSPPSSGRSSPTWCSPTRSTAPRPRCRARCSRRCRSARSPSATRPTRCPTPSSSWPPRTPSSRRAPTACPRPRSTASCSWSRSATRPAREERQIIDRTTGILDAARRARWSSPSSSSRRARVVRDVYMDDRVKDYIVDVVFATREPTQKGMKDLATPHRVRRQPARLHRARPRGARPRLPPPPRLRDPRGRQGHRPRRPPPPRRAHLRGRGRGGDQRADRPPRVRSGRSAVKTRANGGAEARQAAATGAPEAAPGHRDPHAAARQRAALRHLLVRLQGPGPELPRGARLQPRRRRALDRLERLRAHERALRQGLRRGARDDGDARLRHVAERAVGHAPRLQGPRRRRDRRALRLQRHQEQRPRGAHPRHRGGREAGAPAEGREARAPRDPRDPRLRAAGTPGPTSSCSWRRSPRWPSGAAWPSS